MKNSHIIHQRINEIGDTPEGAAKIIHSLIKRDTQRRAAVKNMQDVEKEEGLEAAVRKGQKFKRAHNIVSDQEHRIAKYMDAKLGSGHHPASKEAHAAAIKAYRKAKTDTPEGEHFKRDEPVGKSAARLSWGTRTKPQLPPKGSDPRSN